MQYTNQEMSALLKIQLFFSMMKNEDLTEAEANVMRETIKKGHIPDEEFDNVIAGADDISGEEALNYLTANLDSDKKRFALAAIAEICTVEGEPTDEQQEIWDDISDGWEESFRSMGWAKVHFAAR